MIKFQVLKKITVLTLFFFTWFLLTANVNFAKEPGDENLEKAKELYQKGDWDEAMGLLMKIVTDKPGQKRQVGKAYYWMAKMHYEVGDYKDADKYLREAFTLYPDLVIDEKNEEFRKRAGEIRKEISKKVDSKKKKTIEKQGKKTGKKKFPILLVAGGVVVVGAVALLLLKKKDKKKYTLTVNVGEGVQGNPGSGSNKYEQGATVSYNYSLQNGYKDLEVRLDGAVVSAGGTITMDGDHTLTASAVRLSQCTLSVTKGEGVEGTPASGTIAYDEGTTVAYSYTLKSGYTNLRVLLDDQEVSSSGTFTMDTDHTLTANANKIKPDDNPPTVEIVSPANGAAVSGEVLIKADASDDKGISKVNFYIDNELKESDEESPYRYQWNTTNYTEGNHTIKVIAYDTADQTDEAVISVRVEHPLSNYNLVVAVGEGVGGSPQSGQYSYVQGTEVSYSYSLKSGYSNLVVKLDGQTVPSSGKITMDSNHELVATSAEQFSLTVTKSEGVNGSPDSGTYLYTSGKTVSYNYSLKSGYTNLIVKLDGNSVASSGTITMDRDHELVATCDEQQYTLNVTRGAGVKGSPDSGTYSYTSGETVSYSYSLKSGYTNLVVKLDGQKVNPSGSITMDRDHNLKANATLQQEGHITSVTIKFRVSFTGRNLKVKEKVKVDGVTKIDETYPFDVPPEEDPITFHETFYFTRGLGTMEVKQTADPNYTAYYSGNSCVWSTYYNLSITDYTYTGGSDPGAPQLSESEFYLNVCPWVSSDPGWNQTQTKNITINPPSAAKSLVKPSSSLEKQKTCSNCSNKR